MHQRPDPTFTRRRALQLAGAAATIGAVNAVGIQRVAAMGSNGDLHGADLSNWEVALGDGLWTGPGQAAPSLADIDTLHHGTHSVLHANTQQRGVMAHNISFKRLLDIGHVDNYHLAEVFFRLPDVPTTSNWTYNAQTLEVGMFVWDGESTRLDYGIAIQWVINPWVSNFGHIRAWTQTPSGPEWQSVDYLAPDTAWHRLRLKYRPRRDKARLMIDNNDVEVSPTETPKDSSWGNTIDARFQVEIVSAWPGANAFVPEHRAEFRDWCWATSAF